MNILKTPVPPKSTGLSVIVAILLLGFLAISVIDAQYRSAFADLAKVSVGGYLAVLIPVPKQ
jgi:hypothetical protein